MKLRKKRFLLPGATAVLATPLVAAIACFNEVALEEREIIQFATVAKDSLENRRTLDFAFGSANAYSTWLLNGVFSLIQTSSSGYDQRIINPDTGEATWSDTQKRTYQTEIVQGFEISPNDGVNWYGTLQDPTLEKALSEKIDQISFRLKSGKKLYYSTSKDGKVAATEVEFKMKDMFYGLVRSLYAIEEVRTTGKLEGVDIGLEPFNEAANVELAKEFSSLDNLNGYLFNLFGIDLKGTITANLNAQERGDDVFVIKFSATRGASSSKNTLQVLTDTSIATPQPSAIIDQQAPKYPQWGAAAKYGILTYGKTRFLSSLAVDTTYDNYSIAPYVFTEYDLSQNGRTSLSINKHYIDQELANDPYVVTKITQIQKSSSVDPVTFEQSRAEAYENARDSHEYRLSGEVKSKNIIDKITSKGWYWYNRPQLLKPMNIRYNYSLWGANYDAFNDKSRQLIWGFPTVDQINDDQNSQAIDNFYNGLGADLRSAINGAVNWYTVMQRYTNNPTKTFYPGVVQEGSYEDSNASDLSTKPSYMNSVAELEKIYNDNRNNQSLQMQSSKIEDSKKILEELANEVGATTSDPALVPIFKDVFTDAPESDETRKANEDILALLNDIGAGKIVFKWQKLLTWSDYVTKAYRNHDYFVNLSGYGPDYPGIGSLYQQYLGVFGTNAQIALIRNILEISQSKKIPSTKRPDLSFDAWKQFLVDNSTAFDLITKDRIKTIGVKDIQLYAHNKSEMDPEELKTMQQISLFVTKFLFENNNISANLKDINAFILNNMTSAYSVSRLADASNRSKISEGQRVYGRRDLGFFPQLTAGQYPFYIRTKLRPEGR